MRRIEKQCIYRKSLPGYASLPARSLGETPHCFSIRLSPRLRAGSDAYPGSQLTVLIAERFHFRRLHLFDPASSAQSRRDATLLLNPPLAETARWKRAYPGSQRTVLIEKRFHFRRLHLFDSHGDKCLKPCHGECHSP